MKERLLIRCMICPSAVARIQHRNSCLIVDIATTLAPNHRYPQTTHAKTTKRISFSVIFLPHHWSATQTATIGGPTKPYNQSI